MDFMKVAPLELTTGKWLRMIEIGGKNLSALSHSTSIGIIWRANGHRKHAGAGCDDLVLGRGGGGLGCGGYTGEDEGEDEGANDMFHSGIPLKLYSQKKISLDKPDKVTIGYIME
jgi:hypothetical protein